MSTDVMMGDVPVLLVCTWETQSENRSILYANKCHMANTLQLF